MPGPSVIVVGAGLAGLGCALRLHEAGLPYRVIEASDAVGGRVRTDRVDGFLLDRGFQVLLTAYPECRRVLDYGALDLRCFEPGALIRHRGRFRALGDPWRRPSTTLESALSPVGSPADKLRVARLRRELRRRDLDSIFAGEEGTTLDALRRRGFGERFVESFFRPFLGGVFLERELTTSQRMFEFVFKMFSEGDVAVPATGMQAIPESMAARLRPDSIRFGDRVAGVEKGRCRLESGESIEADRIVLATDATDAARLHAGLQAPRWRSTVCLYFNAERAPLERKLLVLDGERSGPVNNLCVISNVAPSYAPAGRALISVSLIGEREEEDAQLERALRVQLTAWFGEQVAGWRLLRRYDVRRALHDLPPRVPQEAAAVLEPEPGLLVCGDHLERGSIEGAMLSGRAAAERILAGSTKR